MEICYDVRLLAWFSKCIELRISHSIYFQKNVKDYGKYKST